MDLGIYTHVHSSTGYGYEFKRGSVHRGGTYGGAFTPLAHLGPPTGVT
jgi:hypothetical protein